MKSLLFILGAVLLISGLFFGQNINPKLFGTNTLTTDTVETFRQNFNALDNYVRSTTSTLGTFANLATTTGNIPIASSSVGWSVLTVGTSGSCLVASSTAPLGIVWTSCGSVATTTIGVSGGTVNGPAFTFSTTTSAGVFNITNPSGATIRFTIPSNVGFFSNDSGYSSSTAANPTATTTKTAVNGVATTFMRSDASPALASQYSSSSVTIAIADATATAPYRIQGQWQTSIPITIFKIQFREFAAATSVIEIFRSLTIASTTVDSDIIASTTCGVVPTTITSFVTSTLLADNVLVANVSSTAGTPSLCVISTYYQK